MSQLASNLLNSYRIKVPKMKEISAFPLTRRTLCSSEGRRVGREDTCARRFLHQDAPPVSLTCKQLCINQALPQAIRVQILL